jgi:hypothetical protein
MFLVLGLLGLHAEVGLGTMACPSMFFPSLLNSDSQMRSILVKNDDRTGKGSRRMRIRSNDQSWHLYAHRTDKWADNLADAMKDTPLFHQLDSLERCRSFIDQSDHEEESYAFKTVKAKKCSGKAFVIIWFTLTWLKARNAYPAPG